MAQSDTSIGRTLAQRVNVPLLLWVLGLVAYGSLLVWSATSGSAVGAGQFKRQIVGLLIGLVPLAVCWAVDYKVLQHWTGPLSLAGLALLGAVFVPGLGIVVNGQRNWLALGSIRLFQPSEPAKLLFIVILAGVISHYRGKLDEPQDVAKVMGFLALPLLFILAQPDLGTALVFIVITFGMLLVGGMKGRWFLIFGAAALVAVVGLLQVDAMADRALGRDVLVKQYQKDRLTVFLDPTVDPRGAGYNLSQSKIAIGSGGLTGKGLQAGTQSSLHFIPERHTDFIFAVLGEELGFLGSVMLLGLYLALLITALEISASSYDLYGALIVAGLISMWTFQILVNIGMTVGIMPITGIPLPFMSFGSSFMVTNLAGVGMLLSVWARRYGS